MEMASGHVAQLREVTPRESEVRSDKVEVAGERMTVETLTCCGVDFDPQGRRLTSRKGGVCEESASEPSDSEVDGASGARHLCKHMRGGVPRRYDENTCDHGLEKSGFPMSSHPSGGVRRSGSKRALW